MGWADLEHFGDWHPSEWLNPDGSNNNYAGTFVQGWAAAYFAAVKFGYLKDTTATVSRRQVNPSGSLTIPAFGKITGRTATVSVFNCRGQLLKRIPVSGGQIHYKTVYGNLGPGVYIVRVGTDMQKPVGKKIVIP